jgi:hypothetical protein
VVHQRFRLIAFDSITDARRVHKSKHRLCRAVPRQQGQIIVPLECRTEIAWVRKVAVEVHLRQEEHRIRVLVFICCRLEFFNRLRDRMAELPLGFIRDRPVEKQ